MPVASALCALLRVGAGMFPAALHTILPHQAAHHACGTSHILTQMKPPPSRCLAPRAGAPEIPNANLDLDWPFRHAAPVPISSPARLAQSSLASSRQVFGWLGAAPPIVAPADDMGRRLRALSARLGD